MSEVPAEELSAPKQAGGNGRWTRLWWFLAWALSVVLAFVLGTQSSGPAAQPPAPAPSASAEHRADLPQPQTDPKVVELMESLPRRTDDDPLAKGATDAPVVMIMWSDYRCPFCSLFSRESLPQLQKYVDDGTLRIEYRDIPLFGEQSESAAHAGRAAGNQGKFWQFHHVVAEKAPDSGHPDLPQEVLEQYAREAGVEDLERFRSDMASTKVQQAVSDDATEAHGLGISSTPFFIINTTVVSGAQPLEVFTGVIEREADR